MCLMNDSLTIVPARVQLKMAVRTPCKIINSLIKFQELVIFFFFYERCLCLCRQIIILHELEGCLKGSVEMKPIVLVL